MEINYSKHISWQIIGDYVYIINEINGEIFTLESVSKSFWVLIDQCKSLNKILEILDNEYDVENDILKEDINNIMNELVSQKLIIKEDKKMYNKFSLQQTAIKENIPLNVSIELLTKCNWRCKHCYIPNHNNDGLNFEAIKKLFYDLRELGTLEITLTGGEIFLRKDIFYIIELARKLYFRVNLLSNASLLNEEKIKKLSQLDIAVFSTTIFSLKDSIHDSITGCPGSLKKTLHNILLMKKYNIPVKVKTPVMKYNIFEYKEIREFCEYHKFKYKADAAITVRDDGDDSTVLLRVNKADLVEVMKDIDKSSSEVKNPKIIFDLNKEACRTLLYNLHITCNGDVYPCISFVYKVGNIFKSSISDIWNNSRELIKVKKIKNKDLSQCIKCELKNFCSRCPGGALLENNNLYGCSTYNKIMAEALMESLKEN